MAITFEVIYELETQREFSISLDVRRYRCNFTNWLQNEDIFLRHIQKLWKSGLNLADF